MADDRRYPRRPILGIGAIILDRDRVLMVERGRPPLQGYWSLPGGALESGETLEEGLRREILEETGLQVRPRGVVEIFERIMRDTAGRTEYHYVIVDYLCSVSGGTLCAASDCANARWVPRRALRSLNITEGTLPVIEKAFRNRAKYKR